MIKPLSATPPSSPRRPITARVSPIDAALTPGRVAFAGDACLTTPAGQLIRVHAVCWPIVPIAWTVLAQAWEQFDGGRDLPKRRVSSNTPVSWLKSCAPQLGSPFSGSLAEESSVAALITRTPMQIALSVQDARTTPARAEERATHRQALSDCMTIYDQFVRIPGRLPCAMLVARGSTTEVDQAYQQDFLRCHTALPSAAWLAALQLRFWKESAEPLPLELVNVIAAAVLRHRVDSDTTNPIFDAILDKLAHTPPQFRRPAKPKRR